MHAAHARILPLPIAIVLTTPRVSLCAVDRHIVTALFYRPILVINFFVPLKTGRIDITTYLVTGGCGFIGSHLCQALLRRGDAVRVLDDLSTGLLSNLAAGASLIQGDVAEPSLVREALSGTKGCFHLAAVASVELSNREWLRTHHTNLTGTITVFDAAIAAGRIPVVYASSAA